MAALTVLMIILVNTTALNAQQPERLPAGEPLQSSQFSNQEPDESSVVVKKIHSPIKATMLSATFPGLGQAYNRKYWKIPILYGGFGGVVYAFNFNNSRYQTYRKAWVARVDGNPNTVDEFPKYAGEQLQRATNYYRRNLELTYIVGAALYLLNILDATVDAHLLDFDVDENLSMKITPTILSNGNGLNLTGKSSMAGVKLTLSF